MRLIKRDEGDIMSLKIIGFIVGFIIGWLIRKIIAGKKETKLNGQIDIMRIAGKKQEEEKDAIIKGFIEKEKEKGGES